MGKRAAHYTNRIANDICEHIVMGLTLAEALDKIGFLAPTIVTVYKWLELYPDFREKYERARQLQADIHADRMLEMAKTVLDQPRTATAHRVAVDILKWQAEVRNRNRYGKTGEDPGKNKPMDAKKIKDEIKRLEAELGIVESKVKPLKVVSK